MSPTLRIATASPSQTLDLGVRLGRALCGGEVVGLIGPLGAGKTQFAKGVIAGAAAGDPAQVTSPTFVLMSEYAGRVRLCHIDAYRLKRGDELIDLGIDDVLQAGGCVLVEWADRVADRLPDDRLTVTFKITGPSQRAVSFLAAGPLSIQWLDRLACADFTVPAASRTNNDRHVASSQPHVIE